MKTPKNVKELYSEGEICNPQVHSEIEVVGTSMMHGDGKHAVLNLEQDMKLETNEYPELLLFETWVCVHRKCNYLEYRLKEGHREDR